MEKASGTGVFIRLLIPFVKNEMSSLKNIHMDDRRSLDRVFTYIYISIFTIKSGRFNINLLILFTECEWLNQCFLERDWEWIGRTTKGNNIVEDLSPYEVYFFYKR